MFILRKKPIDVDELATEMEGRRKLLLTRKHIANGIKRTALESMSAPAFTEKDQAILDAAEIAARKLNESHAAASRCRYQPPAVEIDEAVPLYKEALDALDEAIRARSADCDQSPLLSILKARREQLGQALDDYEPKGGELLSEYDERIRRQKEEEAEAHRARTVERASEAARRLTAEAELEGARRKAREDRAAEAYESIELD